MQKLVFIILLFFTSYLHSQINGDSVNSHFKYSQISNLEKLNSLKTDWNIINSTFLFQPINSMPSTTSLYSLYAESQINSGINFALSPDVMLSQFQLVNNWDSKKRYGVFAKYLSIAEFMGVVGLAAIHISKYHMPSKSKSNLPNKSLIEPRIKQNTKR